MIRNNLIWYNYLYIYLFYIYNLFLFLKIIYLFNIYFELYNRIWRLAEWLLGQICGKFGDLFELKLFDYFALDVLFFFWYFLICFNIFIFIYFAIFIYLFIYIYIGIYVFLFLFFCLYFFTFWVVLICFCLSLWSCASLNYEELMFCGLRFSFFFLCIWFGLCFRIGMI